MIHNSLRKKLLANDGERLSKLEQHLSRADHRRDGWVTVRAFSDALKAEEKRYPKATNGVARITRDEGLWLSEKLEGRSGKVVACSGIRALLEQGCKEKQGGRAEFGRNDRGWRNRSRRSSERGSSVVVGESQRRRHGSSGDYRQIWKLSNTNSDGSDSSNDGKELGQRRSSKWAIKQGTVGQWLQDVASPMVSAHSLFDILLYVAAYPTLRALSW